MLSAAVQNYLKAIYKLEKGGEKVTTSALAERLSVASASVTNMVKKLAEMKLVRHTPYKEVVLTPAGEKIALEIVRHHRLLELYLAEVMGYSWDRVHDEAEKLEHVISEEFEDRMDEALGRPTTDPHGDPIPSKDGKVHLPERSRLADLRPGASAVRYLSERGLTLNARVEVLQKEPFNGPLLIQVGSARHHVSLEVARAVFVEETASTDEAAPGSGS
jgi:DtxR family Mn-dependent transcriptional regulator